MRSYLDMVDAIVRFIRTLDTAKGVGNAFIPAITLGVIGERAKSSALLLAQLQKKAGPDEGFAAFAIGLARARVEPANQRKIFEELIKSFPKYRVGKLEFAFMVSIPYLLVDSRMTIELLRIMEKSDYELAEGAAAILTWAGSGTGLDLKDVLKNMKRTKDQKKLALYKKVLLRACNYSHLPLLRKELEAEQGELKAIIAAAIAATESMIVSDEFLFFLPQGFREFKSR